MGTKSYPIAPPCIYIQLPDGEPRHRAGAGTQLAATTGADRTASAAGAEDRRYYKYVYDPMESQKDRAKTRGASTSLKVDSFSALGGASLNPLAVAHTTEQSEADRRTQSQEGPRRASSSFQQPFLH